MGVAPGPGLPRGRLMPARRHGHAIAGRRTRFRGLSRHVTCTEQSIRVVGSAARKGRRAGPGCSRRSATSASRQHRQRTGSRGPRPWSVGLRRSRRCAGSDNGRAVGRPACQARVDPAVGDGCDAAWSRARQQRSRPPPDGSGLLPGCRSSRELATGRLPDRGKAAGDPRCWVVRVGLLVGGPSSGTPGEPLVHPLHRRAGRSPARISRTDAP